MSFFSSTSREQRRLLEQAAERAEQVCLDLARKEVLRQLAEIDNAKALERANRLISSCLKLAKSSSEPLVLGQTYGKQYVIDTTNENKMLKVENI